MKHFFSFLLGLIFLLSQSNLALAEGFDVLQKSTVQTQVTTASIATLEKDIANYPTTTKGKQITAAQVAYAQAEAEGMNIVNQYGFITYSSSDTQKLIDEEYLNQKLWNDTAIKVGTAEGAAAQTKELAQASSVGISVAPVIGEAYDISSLLLNKDPITGEQLTEVTRVFTIIGLLSGAGSGKLVRESGNKALETLANTLGFTIDEIMPLAKEVAGGYKFSTLAEMKNVYNSLSIDGFVKQVGAKAEVLKVGKVTGKVLSTAEKTGYINKFVIDEIQLQKKFKHASDFGITETWSKSSGELFKSALMNHLKNTTTQGIDGTYRTTQSVIHFYDSSKKIDVLIDKNTGEFLSSWKLSDDQVSYLLKNGNVQ